MLVSDLSAYDLVPSELAALQAAMPERLLPLQALAVQRGLFGEDDLIVVGPAGTGKSTLGQLLALHAEHQGKRVLHLQPSPGFSQLRRLLLLPEPAPELLQADLVIMDELESLRDAELAALLLRLLQRIQLLKERRHGGPRLVAFSAPLAGLTALATRLRARIVESAAITPAHGAAIGTLCAGRASCASPERLTDPRIDQPALRSEEDLCLPTRASLVEMLVELGRRGPTMLLAPDEASCVRLLSRFASDPSCDFPPAEATRSELAQTAAGRAQALLADSLQRGVAFYGPSLSPRQQAIVLSGVERGEVRLLVAPIGEALHRPALRGVFASVVVYARWRWQREAQSGRFVQVMLDRLELSRLSPLCRDGRFAGPSQVLLYARSAGEAREIWQQQIEAAPRPLPALAASSDARREPAEQLWRRWAEANRGATAISPLELLCVTARGPFALPLPLLLSEQPGADYGARLSARLSAQKLADRPFFASLRGLGGAFDHETLRAVKRGLLLLDWIDGATGPAIEDTYHVFVGLVGRIAADCADRLDALRSVCAAAGWSEAAQRPIGDLSSRLRARAIDEANSGVVRGEVAVESTPRTVNSLVGAWRAKKNAADAAAAQKSARVVSAIPRERRR